jgi:hypothetical protein
MKTLFAFLLVLASLFATAQSDSTYNGSDTIQIEMKAWHFGFIYELSPEKNAPEEFIFVKQAAIKWNGADTAQKIKVAASFDLVVRTFRFLSNVREGIATMPNEEMMSILIPQVMRKPLLLQKLLEIRDENAKAKSEIIDAGMKRFTDIKKMWSY